MTILTSIAMLSSLRFDSTHLTKFWLETLVCAGLGEAGAQEPPDVWGWVEEPWSSAKSGEEEAIADIKEVILNVSGLGSLHAAWARAPHFAVQEALAKTGLSLRTNK